MAVKIEINIPYSFFSSADEKNKFESVSERIAKAFIESIIGDEVLPGDPNRNQPDYISTKTNSTYEVTLAIEKSLIPQIKGIKELESVESNIENGLIKDIEFAVENKSKKKYSTPVNLVVIAMVPYIFWYNEFEFENKIFDSTTYYRDLMFENLKEKYLDSEIFENIYIILPTHDQSFILYNTLELDTGDFMKKVDVHNKRNFPVCKVIECKQEHTSIPLMKYEYIIVNHKK